MTQQTALTTKEKALSLREFLFDKNRLKTFEEALPKWLSAERLLRVVFSTALRNPKILDCSKESILHAVQQCALLGVEPILGRAYLIPYNNNKQIAGKWVKVLECQFQIGYQGLIDLARRSGTISDIYGHNVYEHDDFDITFGANPTLYHRPWYMFPERQEAGECRGAYCVWILKDGTKHSEYMPIQEIHKRRDASLAYQSDLKYGKKDSPWLKWPEDMNLKTVIKHSSKFVPASIEFMEAIEYDSDAEVSRVSLKPFLNGGEPEVTATSADALAAILAEHGLEKDHVERFISQVAERYNSSEAEIADSIIEDPKGFLNEYRKWESVVHPKSGTIKDEIGNLKTKGLTEWEQANRGKIEELDEEDKQFFMDKWLRTIGGDYYAEGQPGYKEIVDILPEDAARRSAFYAAMKSLGDKNKQLYYEALGRAGYSSASEVPEDPAFEEKVLQAVESELIA